MSDKLTALQVLKLVANSTFRPMDREDYQFYADAEEGSLISNHEGFDVVVSGVIEVAYHTGEFTSSTIVTARLS